MKRRSIKAVQNMPEDSLIERIKTIKRRDYQAYAAFVYLFGNRVSEALGLEKKIPTGEYYVYTRYNRKKKPREVKIPKYEIVPNEWEVEPIRASQVWYDPEKGMLNCSGIPTFKIDSRPLREAYVFVDGPNEKPLAELLLSYVDDVKRERGENAPLFNFSRQACYNIFTRKLGSTAFPHKLRDLRATKDSTVYGLDAKDLLTKYNWAQPQMAMYYGQKNQKDIIEKMKKKSEEKTK